MATLYWYKTGVDDNWTTLTGNWWFDEEHTQQASALPGSADSVYLLGNVVPILSSPVTLYLFDTRGVPDVGSDLTSHITIAEGGTLRFGNEVGMNDWNGNASNASTIEFYGMSFSSGIIGNGAIFNDYCIVTNGTVGENAVFNDYSICGGGVIGDGATFNDFSMIHAWVDDLVLNSVIWNSQGAVQFFQNIFYAKFTLAGDWVCKRPLQINGLNWGPGKIIIPRREMDIPIGTGGAKIVVGQAYGYGEC